MRVVVMGTRAVTRLQDYRVPDFLIDKTELSFQLGELATVVSSRLLMRRNPQGNPSAPLVLQGEQIELKQLILNGNNLLPTQYQLDATSLTLDNLPDHFEIQCTTLIQPQKNTSLEGLYKSGTMFCTQCEAEGFRKITYYLDRPDVLSEFTTTILADKKKYPVLLSNGNEEAHGSLTAGNLHWVRWKDPFKKPCYLFALVAGDLKFREDYFITMSGRRVVLRIYVEEKDINKVDFAMASLKKAMRWDEQAYGREYDLNIFMIVAVDDFNMGAMENKGLNIFNTSCVLASPDTTADVGYLRVEEVVAHEYFHNWSGNRVTCRDWFQLSLKEGFTVYRDAEFMASMGSRVVKRIEDATLIRTSQFAEDASPMSHPVQPDSYMEISNFYTLTIYEKGAEVVRMLRTLLGAWRFRKGCDHYFSTYDGQAVTIEEFISSMEVVSKRDLRQFRRWYTQAGTPVLTVHDEYDPATMTYTLTFQQSCPATPDGNEKKAFHIPVKIALLGKQEAFVLREQDEVLDLNKEGNRERILEIRETTQSFVFVDIPAKPIPSLLRGFSAPVKLDYHYSNEDLQFLMLKDDDGFNRWEACQQLGLRVLDELIAQYQQGGELQLDDILVEAYRSVLQADGLDKAMVALMLTLPSEAYLGEQMAIVDVDAIHHARQFARKQLALELRTELQSLYQQNQDYGIFRTITEAMAQRSLKNTALAYLMLLEDKEVANTCLDQFNKSTNMTDMNAALVAITNSAAPFLLNARDKALRLFYRRWAKEALVVNQWFAVQASCPLSGALASVRELMKHEAFDMKNPNKVRALVGTFANQNPVNFHARSGEGYRFLAECVLEMDRLNPQIAARLLLPMTKWQRYDAERRQLMVQSLERIAHEEKLSRDVYEVVSKSLATARV
jgi:aminopeptidase N